MVILDRGHFFFFKKKKGRHSPVSLQKSEGKETDRDLLMPCKYMVEIITHIFHPTNHNDCNVLGKRVSERWAHCGYISPLSPGSGERADRHQGGNIQRGWAVRDAACELCQPSLWSWSLPLLSTARRLPRVSLPQR